MAQTIVLNLVQLLTVLLFAPLVKGWINRWKAVFQSRRGPSVWQPYYDIFKLLRKESVVPEESSWLFTFAPYIYFTVPLVVVLLIPVLTTFPLFMAFMGDMLGGGFILSLGGFFIVLAALDTGSAFAGLGSSRARFVSFMAEPVLMLVFFTVSLVAQSTIPYIVNRTFAGPGLVLSPSHILVVLAFFLVVLAETGRIPVDNPATHQELSMIDEGRVMEHSGRHLALLHWGADMKLFVLLTIWLNVLVTPWGLAASAAPGPVALAVLALLAKMALAAFVIAFVEASYAKLRLLRVAEYLGAAFVVSLLAVITYTMGV